MAGQPKRGIDYVGWNVNIFEDDTRIDELIDAQGWIGYAVYHYLFLRASGSEGYYYRWSYSNAATTARKMGGGIRSETVKQAVSLCLRLGLFDKRLFDEERILTSKEIQIRYMLAIEKRSASGRTVEPKYWLLNREETRAYVIIPSNEHSLPENSHSLPENTTKESKVKESKVNMSSDRKTALRNLTQEQYNELVKLSSSSVVDKYIDKIIKWQTEHKKIVGNPYKQIKSWIDEDRKSKKSNNQDRGRKPSYDLDEWEQYAMSFNPMEGKNEN